MIKRCKYCNNEFKAKEGNILFCSRKCYTDYRLEITYNRIEKGELNLQPKLYRRFLIKKFGCKCMKCDWNEINPITNKSPIELNHIDGNSSNHNLNNLELLCPNCHSLTPNYKSLNNGNGRAYRKKNFKPCKHR